MAGVRFEVDFEVTDPSIPILYPDPRMSPGSLLLFDQSNSSVPATDSGLINGGLVHNVAWETARQILGGNPTRDQLAMTISKGPSFSGNIGKAEITAKKGIHAIISQVNHTLQTQAFGIRPPQAIRDYLFANRSHKFYISQWKENTRLFAATDYNYADFCLLFSSTAQFLTYALPQVTNMAKSSASTQLGVRPGLARELGKSFKNIAFEGNISGTDVGNAGNWIMSTGGQMNAFPSAGYLNKSLSFILYGFYIEDLTVSGRTYAEVDAIDYALYEEAFALGGKFYGDTFTDPATLP